jgi:NAD(P)H-dependent FMN reductase
MSTTKLVFFAGSTRADSFNKRLVAVAVEVARAANAEVTEMDLRDLALPLFDEDFEAANGLPDGAKRMKTLLREADGFLIASPEYNSSISPVLKNVIDWVSRSEAGDEPSLVAYRGKVAALCSASPGALGGIRGLVHLRAILGNLGVFVLPEQVCVSSAHELFGADGKLTDERKATQLTQLAKRLVEVAGRLKP